MTAYEIRPKQLRALLLLLVLVPLIPVALMARFMSDMLKGDRVEAVARAQEFQAEVLSGALRSAPLADGSPAERAARLHAHVHNFAQPSIAIRIVDDAGRLLAGDDSRKGQLMAQERAPAGLEAQVQLFLVKPEVIDEAVAGQRNVYLTTGAFATLLVLAIAVTAAMAVSRQIRLQELKSTSVAIVAHELRTPLSSMRMLVDTLREGRYRDGNQLREYLDLIAGENERLRRIAENFLIFSRLERGRQALELEAVAPHAVAAQAVAPFAVRLAAPGCTFTLEVPETLPEIFADREALTQVLANLLDNALKYTGEEKRIALRAQKAGTALAFTVEDNGIGIASDQRDEIFAPFHQVDQRLSRSREGAGLGLAIVQRIVKAHGGEITVAGEPGKGSVFTVKIPLA
jgi:signal transduction histidine kinase